MAIFKIARGDSLDLLPQIHDGYVYFTTDDGKVYIDHNSTRTCINPINYDEYSSNRNLLQNIIEPNKNLYNPKVDYTQTNAAGAAKSGYTINNDGSITCIRSNGAYGLLYLVNTEQILEVGNYTISGKITLDAAAEEGARQARLAVGRLTTRKAVQLTTARAGSTYIENTDLEGWFTASFEVTEEEPFAFSVMINSSKQVNADSPCIISSLQIEKNDSVTDYVPYGYVPVDNKARDMASSNQTEIKLLKDNTTISVNQNWFTLKNGFITSAGIFSIRYDSVAYGTDKFYYVLKGTTISVEEGYCFNIALYTNTTTESMFFVKTLQTTSYTINQDCYFRFSSRRIDEAASSPTEILKALNLQVILPLSEIVSKLSNFSDSDYYKNIEKCLITDWYEGQGDDYTAEGFTKNSTAAEVISAFDNLMALAPSYISKNNLGAASGENYYIYEYILSPKERPVVYNNQIRPKILITQGQQGFEKSNVYGMYYFIRDLILNWYKSPVLAYIRNHVEIRVIPIVNPWGWDNFNYLNANGISINRNYYVENWDGGDPSDSGNYGGTEPFSEPETIIVRDWVLANKDTSILYFDSHTNGKVSVATYEKCNWFVMSNINDSYFRRLEIAIKTHIEDLTANFIREYSLTDVGDSLCGTHDINSSPGKGAARSWGATQAGILSLTVEGFQGFPGQTAFTGDIYKANSEILGNWIIAFLREYGGT